MRLVPLSTLLGEGKRKRRTAYRSGRRELIGIDDYIRSMVTKAKRSKPKDKPGRLIKRSPLASRQRWRVY